MSSGRRSISSPEVAVKSSAKEKKRKGKRKLAESEVVGGKLSARGQLHVLMETIRKRLSESNRKAFKQTCFGDLLEMPYIKPQMQLIFLLLQSLQLESEVRNTMSFVINDQYFELGPPEFFCLTGLSFKESSSLPLSSDMHGNIFGGRDSLKAADIKEAFFHYSVKHKGTGSHVLKLALLYVVYGLLLNRDQVWQKIDIRYMHLVDDLDSFNKYPWGRVAYDHLIYWTHRARGNLDRLILHSNRPSTDVCGFYVTLQIFAFEIMPLLARNCAERLNSDAFPRICRWMTSVFFKYTQLLSYFHSSDAQTMAFEFSDDERDRLRAVGLSIVDAVQRQSEADVTRRKNLGKFKLVDEEEDDEQNQFEDKDDDDLKVLSSPTAGDWEEVKKRKVSETSATRKARREQAAKIGKLFREATMASSSSPESADRVTNTSIQQLQTTILAMNVRAQMDSECIQKMSKIVMEMNARLTSVVGSIDGLEKLVASLNARIDAMGIRHTREEDTLNIDEMVTRHATGGLIIDELGTVHGDEGVKVSAESCMQEVNEGKMNVADEEIVVEDTVKQSSLDCRRQEVIEGKMKVGDREAMDEDTVRSVEQSSLNEVLEGVKEADVDHLDHGDAFDVQLEAPLPQSPEFDISDTSAYSPQLSPLSKEEGQSSARKRLFEDDDATVGPIYGTITGKPVPKKLKTKGKNGSAPTKLKTMDWFIFDPSREYHWDMERDFYHWYERGKGMRSKDKVPLATYCKTAADWSWFEGLYTTRGWLSNDHLDVLMNLLIIYSKKFPTQFKQDWTLIESFGSQVLVLPGIEKVPERIIPYVEGHHPRQGGKPWHDVEVVYGVANVGKDHWVLYRLDLILQRVVVFDSMSAGQEQWDDVKGVLGNVCKNVPLLIEFFNVFRNKTPKPTPKKVWDLVRYEHPPQQRNVDDCGLLCIKALECMLTGNPFSLIDPMRTSLYRRAYCVELFAKHKEEMAAAGSGV